MGVLLPEEKKPIENEDENKISIIELIKKILEEKEEKDRSKLVEAGL
jgi:hypothetical protein